MKNIFVFLLSFFLVSPLFGKTVVLYHTSDAHGFFYPQKGVGGYAALAALLEQEKNPFLLLDSGDFANGTAETKKTKGLAAIELMNAVGYQAATIGNHEFDFKDEGLAPMMKKTQFSVLAANLREKKTDLLPTWAKAYDVFELGGVKVAVIGLANRHPTQTTKQYYFTKPLVAFAAALQQVEKERPSVVVVLVHDSLADYRNGILPYLGEIAKKYSGRVHVVLGGHAHKIFQNEFIKGVLYAESGCYLKNVTQVTVELDDKTGKVQTVSSQLIPLQVSKTGTAPKIAEMADSYKDALLETVIGTAGMNISKNPLRKMEKDSPLDNWISDLGRQYTQTEIFIHNTGETRVSLEKGSITQRTLIDLFPFEDKMFRMQLTGEQLKKFIRSGLTPWNKYVYSGLQISYSVSKKGFVKDLQVLLNGQPIENKKTYTVGTNSYIAKLRAFAGVDKKSAGDKSVRQLVAEAFQQGPVYPPDTGRIILK